MPDTQPRYLLPFDTYALPHHLTDVLVVGTGVAGYSAALAASEAGARVLVIAKGDPGSSNTGWAQGGIAAVLDGVEDDSASLHADDTCVVGQGLCDRSVVENVVSGAHEGIERLNALGAHFDEPGEGTPDATIGTGTHATRVARGLEGGHSVPRILHARGDATGAEIRDTLAQAARERDRLDLWGGAYLVDLLTDEEDRCRGALVFVEGELRAVWAGAVVLGTGGYAQIFRESTNVPGATGDGVAVAYRAGAVLQDMEFVQFHPTTLYLAGVPRLLITEAIRGEGAHVVDDRGQRFLLDVHESAELAPRDVISRAITHHLAQPDVQNVFLDMRHLDATRMAKRFPGVVRSCRDYGLDIASDLVPIRPAAHYSIGGVRTDLTGRTSVPGLFAAGEVTATGLHGANRLASNSLLEGLVMGGRSGRVAGAYAADHAPEPVRLSGKGTGAGRGSIDTDDLRTSLKAVLWREAGIVRSGGQLAGAVGAVNGWEGFALRVGPPSEERFTLVNMLCVARLLTTAALFREESRGTHWRRDFPERDDDRWAVHIVHQRDKPEPERILLRAPVAQGQAS
ncbi:MAG: L-aspartate oxidase [Planctomycetota bacterium]|nr:L-aspartate oxidase [Planctomycetota bacterium]